MPGIATTVALGAGLFALTNVDDLILLVAFAAERRIEPWRVVLGQYVGIAALVGISAFAASLSRDIPPTGLGCLGLVPIALGLKALWWRAETTLTHQEASDHGGGVLTVAAMTVANGGDNLATYTPAFAARPALDLVIIGIVFAIMTGLWCFVAYRLADYPAWRRPLHAVATTALPYVLVLLGCLIFGRSFWRPR